MNTVNREWASRKAKGFTIVELLIVIVVIGILAAIVVVAFNGVQRRAVETSIQSDLKNFAKNVEMHKAEYGRYPINAAELELLDIKINHSNYAVVNSSGAPRNNFYYVLSNSSHPDGQAAHYAVGVVTKYGNTICMLNGKIVVASCSGGANTMLLISTDTSHTAWGPSGHSDTTGWASWTQ